MLQDAAVVGEVFWAGAVTEMGNQDQEQVQAVLHELTRKELVRPARRSSMAGQAEYSFAHVLIRDVCYAQIPRAKRAQRHRRAAAWIEHMAGDRVQDYAEVLAYHTVMALELARASGHQTQELEDQARRFLLLAGERAIGLDTSRAIAHLNRALELAHAAAARTASS